MMKKIKWVIVILIIILGITVINVAKAAAIKENDTLGDLRNQLKELQKKQTESQNKKKKTQSEIAANKSAMIKASNDLEETKAKIVELSAEIEKTNGEVTELKSKTEELLRRYQKLKSENIYLNYITGASSMTELIMRMDAISQLSDENEAKIDELELLIISNDKLNKQLDKYQDTLNDKIVAYEASVAELNNELSELELGSLTIEQEITSLKETIKSYENLGCKDNQKLTECVNVANNSGWLKPVPKGRINSTFGYRAQPTATASSYHRGVDIGVSEGTSVYATAAGSVGAIVRKSSCGGNMVYIWAYVNGKPYTYVFMHLLEIKVSVGDKVGVNTIVGISGGGSTAKRNGGYDTCTTGAHLHYGLAANGFFGTKELPLSKFNSNAINPPGYPGLYQWFYSR